MVLANRELETDTFKALFLPEAGERILTIQAESGFGKTNFIGYCLKKNLPNDIDTVFYQLKGGYVGISEIFSRFVRDLQWNEASNFAQNLNNILGVPHITIDGNWLVGFRQYISVHLGDSSPADRKDRVVTLTDALFRGLEEHHRNVLVAFDTYEQATEEVRGWISHAFLVRAARSDKVCVLIAGQHVPDHNEGLEWSQFCKPLKLYGITEAEKWVPFIKFLGYRLPTPDEGVPDPLSWFGGICAYVGGNPVDIRRAIEAMLPRMDE